MSFGIPVRNGLGLGLTPSTTLSSGRTGPRPALTLNFLTSTALSSNVTFSRGSNATLTDSTGKITYAPNNLLTNSESFEATAWAKSAAGTGSVPVVTANAAIAPDGTTTADQLVFALNGGTTSSDWSWITQGYTAVAGGTYIISLWARTISGTAKIIVDNTSNDANLADITTTWTRVSFARTDATGGGRTVRIGLRGSNVASGQSESATVLFWGAQLEQVTYQTTPGTYNSTTPKNLLGYTQEFDNAAWTKTNATITANAIAAPDGTLSADKLVEDTANSSHRASQGITTTVSPYTFSVYLKAAERSFALIYTGTVNTGVMVNLSTGATNVVAGITAPSSSSVTAVGNGWYRCSITFTATAATNVMFVYAAINSTTYSYTGDGTSGIYVWGAQLSNSASLDPYVYNPGAAPTSAAYYGPRFDYDPVTLAPKGLLIEAQRSNLALYSEQFDNAAWTGFSTTITANAATAPSGVATADKLVESAGAAFHAFYTTASPTGSVTGNYTFSVYAKVGERRYISMDMGDYANGTVFDLQTGTVTGTNTTYTAAITPAGNGWYRCSVSRNFTVATSLFPQILLSTSATVPNSYTGDGTSGVFIWGAQMEVGAFATSYIPTVASTVTRSADVAQMLGTNFSSWYNQTEGTFVADGSTFSNSSLGFVTAYSTASNYLALRRGAGAPAFRIQTTAGVQGDFGTLAASGKTAAAYRTDDFAVSSNGAAVATDTAGVVPAATQFELGALIGQFYLNGHIRTLSYYNTRLTNTQLQALTA